MGNSAEMERGGALANYAGKGGVTSPTLAEVVFTGNSAAGGGAVSDQTQGGVLNATYTNVTFTGNAAAGDAGAMLITAMNEAVRSTSRLSTLSSAATTQGARAAPWRLAIPVAANLSGQR